VLAGACASAPPPASPLSIHNAAACTSASIRDVDFLDRTYEIDGERVTVTHGELVRPAGVDGDDQGFVEVLPPTYGDVDGDGREDAIVMISNNGGGSGRLDEARVFAMRCDRVVQIATITGGDRADGGLVEVSTVPHGLLVERNVLGPDDAACCATSTAIEYWRWNGHALVLDPASEDPDDDHAD
jgi:hypothetical protein